MRVIAGRAKGHRLKGPPSAATRPTSDKVREAIFGMLSSLLESERASEASPWEGLVVLDLYAGTGALGIEALSRGAARADFVEANTLTCQVIRVNLATTGLQDYGRVHCQPVHQFLQQAGKTSYDLVFVDAPYASPELEDVIELLATRGLVQRSGWLVVEHARQRPLRNAFGELVLWKARRYGDTEITILRRQTD